MVEFKNPETAEQYECTLTQDQSVIVLQAKPAHRGKVSTASPQTCEQMIKEGVPFIRRKVLTNPPS